MTKRTHNKKRNVGILYELLVRKVSESLIEGDERKSDQAIGIIEEFFCKESVLLKEYRLFSALTKTYVESDHIASKLLVEARKGAQDFDHNKLEHEKSRLIKKINKTFDDNSFFNSKIPDYKKFASIQTLLNAWREPEKFGLGRIAESEERVVSILKEKKQIEDLADLKTKEVNPLASKLMLEKFNKKFQKLSGSQKRIVETVLSENSENLKSVLVEEKAQAFQSLKELQKEDASEWVAKKIEKVRPLIESLNPEDTTDSNIQKFMTVAHMTALIEEES